MDRSFPKPPRCVCVMCRDGAGAWAGMGSLYWALRTQGLWEPGPLCVDVQMAPLPFGWWYHLLNNSWSSL